MHTWSRRKITLAINSATNIEIKLQLNSSLNSRPRHGYDSFDHQSNFLYTNIITRPTPHHVGQYQRGRLTLQSRVEGPLGSGMGPDLLSTYTYIAIMLLYKWPFTFPPFSALALLARINPGQNHRRMPSYLPLLFSPPRF
jgi:hypothetical protein